MRSFSRWWVLALLLFGACNEVTGPPPGTARVEVEVSLWPGYPAPIEGVELCPTDDTSRCTTTDANGEATLWLPVGETSFTMTKESYASYLVPIDNPEDGSSHHLYSITDDLLEKLYEDIMAEWPLEDMGRITSDTIGDLAEVTFELFDTMGAVEAPKQYYRDAGPSWSLELTATTTEGFGEGGFVEVSPGVYEIELGGKAVELDCVPITGWGRGFGSNRVRFPVLAGYATSLTMACK